MAYLGGPIGPRRRRGIYLHDPPPAVIRPDPEFRWRTGSGRHARLAWQGVRYEDYRFSDTERRCSSAYSDSVHIFRLHCCALWPAVPETHR